MTIEHLPECTPDDMTEPDEEGIKDCLRCGLWERAEARLEYLRGELRAQRISYGELAELQGLVPYIAADDVELLEAAGVPEHDDR